MPDIDNCVYLQMKRIILVCNLDLYLIALNIGIILPNKKYIQIDFHVYK